MLLLKDGSVEIEEYCVDEEFDEQTHDLDLIELLNGTLELAKTGKKGQLND